MRAAFTVHVADAEAVLQPGIYVDATKEPEPMGQPEEETLPDTELFIRRTFDTNPQKGCELLFRLYYKPMCTHAVRFVYLVSNRFEAGFDQPPIRLRGLKPDRQYKLREVNLPAGQSSPIDSTVSYSGDFLMTVGLNAVVGDRRTSVVQETAEAGSAGW